MPSTDVFNTLNKRKYHIVLCKKKYWRLEQKQMDVITYLLSNA